MSLDRQGEISLKLDRSKPPDGQVPLDIELPTIQKAVLDNGLSVWLVEKHTLPSVAMNLVLNAGTDHDHPSLPGLTSFTAEMMDAGTKDLSALTIADRLDFIGAAMSIHAGIDATSAFLYTLTKHLEEALTVFGQVISSPAFADSELERIRSQRLTSLLQHQDRPSFVANIAFHRILYGNHPYGSDPSGTEASLRAILRDDVDRFYRAHYRPDNATLIVVGDTLLPDLLPMLQKAFRDWERSSGETFVLEPVSSRIPRKIYLIDRPNAPQSEVRIGCPALARTTPDFFPVIVMNRILGGQFSSRINLNVRERNGLTYGAGSTFRFAKREGPFVVSGGFITAETGRAIAELLHEIDTMRAKGLNDEELAFSKKGIGGSFALNFETSVQIATAFQSLVLFGLPDDYFSHYVKNVQNVTMEDVQKVAMKYLDTTAMAILVVGDVKQVREGIEKLNLGEIVLCDADGMIEATSLSKM